MFDHDPRARPANCVVRDRVRITLLTDRLVRFEYAADGAFENRATLAVCNRRTRRVPRELRERGGRLTIDTGALRIAYSGGGKPFAKGNLEVRFRLAGKRASWRPGQKNPGNLGGTLRTLDGMDGGRKRRWRPDGTRGPWRRVKLPDGLLSRDGWSLVDDSKSVVLDPAITGDDRAWPVARPRGRRQDLYLLAHGRDYRGALRDAALVFGRQPLPPRFALGYWYSKYWAYTDREIEELVGQFDTLGVPLDVMVIDMDWHKIGWTGYSWSREYFPDPAAHLAWLHDRDLKVTLNLHPADGVGEHEDRYPEMVAALGADKVAELRRRHGLAANLRKHYLRHYGKSERAYGHVPFDITDPDFMRAYFEILHRPLEAEGVDFWWMDWQQGESTALPGLDTLPWINQLHWEDQGRNPARRGRRPLCFSRFGGIGAGRYPVGFSGDTHITWRSLAYQPWFTATAANVLYGWWSHDIGGHMGGENTPELYTRWLQFGVYAPVLRTHASKDRGSERRVFEYPSPYKFLMMACLRRRYELVPYIYGAARHGVDDGLSVVRPLYYDWPEHDEAYRATGQFLCGDDLLVAPVARPVAANDGQAPVDVWLPPGDWYDTAHGRLLEGGRWHEARYLLAETPVFARAGAVVPGQGPVRRLRPGSYRDLVITAYPGGDGAATLYEDDGISRGYLAGESATIALHQRATATGRTVRIGKAKGTFRGFRARRGLELRLPGSRPPRRVLVDDAELAPAVAGEGWSWDGDTATTVVRLRRIDVTAGCRVRVVGDRSVPPRRLAGLAGLMRRLVAIGREVALVSPWRTQFGEERFAVHLAQTGNRMTRDPATTAAELAALRRQVERLPEHLAAYRRVYRRWQPQNREARDTLSAARRLAVATVAAFC